MPTQSQSSKTIFIDVDILSSCDSSYLFEEVTSDFLAIDPGAGNHTRQDGVKAQIPLDFVLELLVVARLECHKNLVRDVAVLVLPWPLLLWNRLLYEFTQFRESVGRGRLSLNDETCEKTMVFKLK